MNLYLIAQTTETGYDTYDSAVVAAPDEDTARNMDPGSLSSASYGDPARNGKPRDWSDRIFSDWCHSADQVTVTLIGTAAPTIETPRVLCASFNAG